MTHKPFIPAWLDDLGLDPYAFRVFCHIYRRGEFYGSTKSAAETCGMDRKRLFKALAFLGEKGLISKQTRPGKTSVYIIAPVPKTEQLPVPQTEQEVSQKRNDHPCRKRNTKGIPFKGNPIKEIQPKVELPFSSEEFQASWDDWNTYRKQLKKPLTEIGIQKQLKKLKSLGEQTAIIWIETAIEKGWQGLYEPPQLKSIKPTLRPLVEKTTYQRNGHSLRPLND